MKILVIDNNLDEDCWGSKDIVRFLKNDSENIITVRRGPHLDLNLSPTDFDKVIVSGSRASCLEESHWIDELDSFVSSFLKLNRPFLGICFGHQTLCRVLGGRKLLSKSNTPEFGWTKINIHHENLLFSGLSNPFYSYSSHYEEVSELPSHTICLASSERCSIQAIQIKNKPQFGIQFHPEKLEEEGNKSLIKKAKIKNDPSILGLHSSHLIYSKEVGEIIFNNFLNLK